MRHIIIPAGGKATRFNGVLKELAPLPNGETPLQRALVFAATKLKADKVYLISNKDKQRTHFEYIYSLLDKNILSGLDVHIPVQQSTKRDLLDAIVQDLNDTAGGLLLPDTITDADARDLNDIQDADIAFGVFSTKEPHRFSIIQEDRIYTKPKHLFGYYPAWGMVLWSDRAARYMLEIQRTVTTYDELFQRAMHIFNYRTFALQYYYDIGTPESYLHYIGDSI